MVPTTRLPLNPGEIFAGRYKVEHLLGEGGMGKVVAATRIADGARVAIKCLLPNHRSNPRAVGRFEREARLAARLGGEHVPRIFEWGHVDGEGPRAPYLVMEHLEGTDLRSLVKNGGPLPARDAAAVVAEICTALAEAHALGVVHRDLKPANVMLVRAHPPQIKVLDFGIAKLTEKGLAGDDLEPTEAAVVMGSPQYMAPEQMLDARDVDARADVWSLGVLLYWLASGCRPFEGESSSEIALALLYGAPRPLAEVCPDLPEGFEAVILRCLEKRREDRFPDVASVREALAPFLGEPSHRPPPKRRRAARRRLLFAGAGLLAVLTIAASAFALTQARPHAPAAAASTG
jgi:eukaryotic-like serine/threonine-protein kinase